MNAVAVTAVVTIAVVALAVVVGGVALGVAVVRRLKSFDGVQGATPPEVRRAKRSGF